MERFDQTPKVKLYSIESNPYTYAYACPCPTVDGAGHRAVECLGLNPEQPYLPGRAPWSRTGEWMRKRTGLAFAPRCTLLATHPAHESPGTRFGAKAWRGAAGTTSPPK